MSGPPHSKPLAERLRPQDFYELMGQEAIWAPGKPLWQLAATDAWHSLILWGPPGTGKTSLANLIARKSQREVVMLSAVHATVKDIRAELNRSDQSLAAGGRSILLFMDEIHRLSKSQQDVLLPSLENGSIKFIGATTENPSFEVNRSILSRGLVFHFNKISADGLQAILRRALAQRALGSGLRIDDELLASLGRAADGDARRALNLLEALSAIVPPERPAMLSDLAGLIQDIGRAYDKTGDQHYDVISAFIKSVRASHPDAAIYYLARMLDAGEDPNFIARRLIILAAEDIGNANPTGLLLATSAAQATAMIGMPEARIILAQVCTYLAASPKSNRSYNAINTALSDVQKLGSLDIPLHLRNATSGLMRELGYGAGYKYAHDDLEGARQLTYLPESLSGRRYYEPSENGAERQLLETLKRLRPYKD